MALTTVSPALQDTQAQYTGFKNRIINGAMMIDQRNAGASVTGNNDVFSCDRWKCVASVASKFTIQQSTTAPVGFTNSLAITSSSAYIVGAGENFGVRQILEGYSAADLAWGTANAATVTLSFWVRSSLTGTFGGSVFVSTNNIVFSYTISAANTWEYKSVVIPGPTSGTWEITNNASASILFSLGAGATLSTTAGTWVYGTAYRSATGAVSVVGTSGATFYLTGVQLEKGSTATSFDYRPYGTELALCQRYYWKWPGTEQYMVSTFIDGTSKYNFFVALPVIMRTNPTATTSTMYYRNGSTYSDGSITGSGNYPNGSYFQYYGPSAPNTWGTSLPCYITTGWSWSAEL